MPLKGQLSLIQSAFEKIKCTKISWGQSYVQDIQWGAYTAPAILVTLAGEGGASCSFSSRTPPPLWPFGPHSSVPPHF